MVLLRKYEERIYFLFLEGRISGSIHQSHGQEACAVGMLIRGDGLHGLDASACEVTIWPRGYRSIR